MTDLVEACARAIIQARDTNRNFRLNPPYGEEMEAAKYEARAVIPVVLDTVLAKLREPVLGQSEEVNIPPHPSDSPVHWAERVRYHAILALKPEAQS